LRRAPSAKTTPGSPRKYTPKTALLTTTGTAKRYSLEVQGLQYAVKLRNVQSKQILHPVSFKVAPSQLLTLGTLSWVLSGWARPGMCVQFGVGVYVIGANDERNLSVTLTLLEFVVIL
jgi:hypothetical protein